MDSCPYRETPDTPTNDGYPDEADGFIVFNNRYLSWT